MPEVQALPPLRGLYAITPDGLAGSALMQAVEALLSGGCRWLQYRDKCSGPEQLRRQAAALNELCRAHGAALIINDDLELALEIGAAGVHLGREDGALAAARRQLGPEAVLGASCYQDFQLARQAQAAGASYVAFGAVHPSATKPQAARASLELFRQAAAGLPLPACAIGGITLDNAAPVIAAGARLVAVIADLFQDPGDLAALRSRAAAYQRLFEDLP